MLTLLDVDFLSMLNLLLMLSVELGLRHLLLSYDVEC